MIEAVFKLLTAAAAVTALVSTRIHYGQKPEGETHPSIVLERITDTQDATLDGAEVDTIGSVRVNIFAAQYLAIEPVVAAVRGALHGIKTSVSVGSPAVTLPIGYLFAGDAQEIPVINQDGKNLPPFYGRFVDVDYYTN